MSKKYDPLGILEKEESGSDKKIDKFALIHIRNMKEKDDKKKEKKIGPGSSNPKRRGKKFGGLMEATQRLKRQGLKGGGLCKRGMNREAIGKNS